MKKLSQLLESINEIDSLLELDFKDKKAFQKYQSVHKMKPTTKVNIAGKDTTVGDETGDDSETPQAPKKTTGADIEKQADKSGKEQDDIEKDIAGDLMGDEPKGDTTADTLTKGLKDGGLNPYKDGPMINQALDDIGGDHSDLKKKIDTYGDNVPSSRGKSEAQYQKEIDKYKEEGEKLSNDIVDAISDDIKELSKITTRYTNRIDEIVRMKGANNKLIKVPDSYSKKLGLFAHKFYKTSGMGGDLTSGVEFGYRRYHKLPPNDEFSGSVILKRDSMDIKKKDINLVMKNLKSVAKQNGINLYIMKYVPDRNEPFIEFKMRES